jgi:hypothetical protein
VTNRGREDDLDSALRETSSKYMALSQLRHVRYDLGNLGILGVH